MIKYTSVDRILSIIQREVDTDVFTEDDFIEWIGEAIEFLNIHPVLIDRVKLLKVNDFKAKIPKDLSYINLIVRPNSDNTVEEYLTKTITKIIIKDKDECGNSKKDIIISESLDRIIKDIKTNNDFIPVRLADSKFFNSIVCNNEDYSKLNESALDEYSIIGTINKELLFSFKKGEVLISYKAMALDEETGYPLIPDNEYFIAAITYYLKWKISEAMMWKGREGYNQLLQYSKQMWDSYVIKAKSWARMPKTIDEWQNLTEQQYNMIPDFKAYYRAFKGFTRYGKGK